MPINKGAVPRRVCRAVDSLTVNQLLDLMYLLDIPTRFQNPQGDYASRLRQAIYDRLDGKDG